MKAMSNGIYLKFWTCRLLNCNVICSFIFMPKQMPHLSVFSYHGSSKLFTNDGFWRYMLTLNSIKLHLKNDENEFIRYNKHIKYINT